MTKTVRDFVDTSTSRTNDRGTAIHDGFIENGDRYAFDFHHCRADGWEQYDTDQDASYFGVWVNEAKRETFTYCEGDTSLVVCSSLDGYRAELLHMAGFYGKAPPVCVTYGEDGARTEHYADRPGDKS